MAVVKPHQCPYCDGKTWKMGYDEDGEFIYECVNCGFIGQT